MSNLVLERKNNESVILTLGCGDKVRVGVNFKSLYQVALQFQAPRYVAINRDSLHEKKKVSNSLNVKRVPCDTISKLGVTRKTGQGVTITIDGNKEIHVGVIIRSYNKVALFFDAPEEVAIYRSEVQSEIDNRVSSNDKIEPSVIFKKKRTIFMS